jgi:hypothetical protein
MSRLLNKSEFLVLLKDIVDKLESGSIRYEIPFTYKDKKAFDSIKIIVSQEIDIAELEKLFSSNQYESKGRFIDFYYKDFRIIFIRAVESEFFITFFYYSWDILPTLMNVMFNKMGLDLTPSGLRYIGSSKSFIVSSNIKLIIEFLDLDFDFYMKHGFRTIFDQASFITTSSYFNQDIFKDYELNKNDFFYLEKQSTYEYAKNLFNNFNEIQFHGYEYSSDLDSYVLNIDTMFEGSDFLKNVTRDRIIK